MPLLYTHLAKYTSCQVSHTKKVQYGSHLKWAQLADQKITL